MPKSPNMSVARNKVGFSPVMYPTLLDIDIGQFCKNPGCPTFFKLLISTISAPGNYDMVTVRERYWLWQINYG